MNSENNDSDDGPLALALRSSRSLSASLPPLLHTGRTANPKISHFVKIRGLCGIGI